MDTLVFWTAKLARMLLSPDSLLLLLLLAAWLLLRADRVAAGRRLLAMLIWVLGAIAVFPVDEWLLYPLERRFAPASAMPARVDGIILLGGAEETRFARAWDRAEVNQAGDRYLAFLMLARAYPEAKLVFSGGSNKLVDQELKEAEVAERIAREQGIAPGRLQLESAARNTAENARMVHAMVKPAKGENWLLVSSAFHLPRATGLFCKAGWSVIPYAADHRSAPGQLLRLDLDLAARAERLTLAVTEWAGLLAYYLMGKTDAFLPGRCTAGDDA